VANPLLNESIELVSEDSVIVNESLEKLTPPTAPLAVP
jgi:hypothetical protein